MAVWKDMIIPVNGFARSGKKIKAVRKIVMHYTANAGAGAMNHYNYFKNLKDRYASAHFFVDKLEALCIIPLSEMAYHANDVQKRNANGSAWRGVKELLPNANELSVGIEMCMEKDGSFHPDMIKRAEDVAVELCKRYGLDPLTDIVRHRDVTYKNCPAPWVANPSSFDNFKKAVNTKLKGAVAPKPTPTPTQVYRVRKTWEDAQSQIGAFGNLESAKDLADKNAGFEVYDNSGKVVYPVVKAPVAPKPVAPKVIGNLVVEASALNIRKDANLDAQVVSQAIKGAKFPVYEQKNGMFKIGEGKWVSANTDYSKYTPVAQPAPVAPKPAPKPSNDLVYSRTLKQGMEGADVKALQTALNKLSFNCGTPDGAYGAKTKDAVARFQSVHLAYEVDGIAGKKTIDKINSLI